MLRHKHFLFILLFLLISIGTLFFINKSIPDSFQIMPFTIWLMVLLCFNFLSWPYLLRRMQLLPFYCNAFILLFLTHLFFCFVINMLSVLLNEDIFLYNSFALFFFNLLPFLPFVFSKNSNQYLEQ
jgi:hypothetical protein